MATGNYNDLVSQAQKQLKGTLPGSAKDLVGGYLKASPKPEITPVSGDAAANISGHIDTVFEAKNDLPFAKEVTANQTVAGQLKDLLATDSPYLEQGREVGRRYAASRGLLSSDLAAGYAEGARIGAALPIAQQDASTFAQAARQYQAHLETLIEQANQGDINAQLQLQAAGYNSQLSAQQHAQNLYEQALNGDINARLQLEQANQNAILTGQQGAINSRLQQEQGDINSRLQREQNQYALQQIRTQGDIQKSLQAAGFAHDKVMAEVNHGFQVDLAQREYANQSAILGRQQQFALNMDDRDFQQQTALSRQEYTQTLSQINVQANNDRQRDAAAASAAARLQYTGQSSALLANSSAEIASVYQMQGLTPQQQANAVAQIIARQRANQDALNSLWQQDALYGSTSAARMSLPSAGRAP